MFGVSPDRSARFDLTKLVPMLEDVHERLSGVTIECLPYADFIQRYDRPATLFYLDPPYFGCENDYGKNLFSREEFQRLAADLSSLKGRFIMSINDTPAIRATFAAFHQIQVSTTYSVMRDGSKTAAELLITNVADAKNLGGF